MWVIFSFKFSVMCQSLMCTSSSTRWWGGNWWVYIATVYIDFLFWSIAADVEYRSLALSVDWLQKAKFGCRLLCKNNEKDFKLRLVVQKFSGQFEFENCIYEFERNRKIIWKYGAVLHASSTIASGNDWLKEIFARGKQKQQQNSNMTISSRLH